MTCAKCQGTGFLNMHELPTDALWLDDIDTVLEWIERNEGHDVQVCDCCGDGETWYGEPGSHYNRGDPAGEDGPYAYNGGLCECH